MRAWRQRPLGSLLLALLPAPPLVAQGEAPISVDRVREVVTFLASDELAGRGTPSPGLERAAEYLAQRFADAGLQPLRGDRFFHRYELAGLELDSTAIALALSAEGRPDLVFEPDADVRLLRTGERRIGEHEQATVLRAGDPRTARMLMAGGGRRPIVLEVADTHPLWQRAEGRRIELTRRRTGARPLFLVRQGLLPPAAEGPAEYLASYRVPDSPVVPIPLRNVVGVLPGAPGELASEYVLVSAHYDHLGVGPPEDGDAVYNGADDDASGTTAVVLLAEALAAGPKPKRSLLFACFSGEEKGLRGSRAFVEQPPLELQAIVAGVNIEMIGRPRPGQERRAWITGAGYSDFAAIVTPALHRAGIEVTGYELADRLFAASDNFSFARRGIVAHSISAGSLHADYHRPTDEVDRLDLEHMTAVIRGLAEAVRELANRPGRPAYNDAGRELLERWRR